MNDNKERCLCCGMKFKPSDRVVACSNETGEAVDRCVLCGEHFKARSTLVSIRFQHIEAETVALIFVCALRGQLPEVVRDTESIYEDRNLQRRLLRREPRMDRIHPVHLSPKRWLSCLARTTPR